ncbi:hypothetical protein DJ70_12290, partial [Halorubrum halodurans]
FDGGGEGRYVWSSRGRADRSGSVGAGGSLPVIAVAHLLYGVVLGRVFAGLTLADDDVVWLPGDPADR